MLVTQGIGDKYQNVTDITLSRKQVPPRYPYPNLDVTI